MPEQIIIIFLTVGLLNLLVKAATPQKRELKNNPDAISKDMKALVDYMRDCFEKYPPRIADDLYPLDKRFGEEHMYLLGQFIVICRSCHRWRGWVIERFNGAVRVACICDLKPPHPNPCMIVTQPESNQVKFWWKPISDHYGRDGKSWHTPFFGGPAPSGPYWLKRSSMGVIDNIITIFPVG
jgi:hypothetical protein